jgi:heme/copper-type cytochrome/quinol oxidase subunit 4
MQSAEKSGSVLKSDVIIYLCILAIAGLQIVLAYQKVELAQQLFRMLGLAIIQAGLAIMFFMHLRAEKRNLLLFLAIGTIFVLGMMNMIWSDSFRLLHMRPLPS